MKCAMHAGVVCLMLSMGYAQAAAQQTAPANSGAAVVPQLVNYSGVATNAQGKAISGIAGVSFAIYSEQYEGSPLWLETQNVQADSRGNFTAQLGAATSGGVPLQLFSSGQARWLGVRVDGGEEQPRVLLLSVPYALKAADAQTLGGLPPSAFVLSPTANAATISSSASVPPSSAVSSPVVGKHSTKPVGGSGTADYVPLWTDSSGDLGNSILYQLGTGTSAKIGINLKAPLATLDVNGETLIRGILEPVTKGYATATKSFFSNPLDLEASAFNSTTQKASMQHFEWVAEPTGNNTSTPGATLNLLFGQDTGVPGETGVSLSTAGALTANAFQIGGNLFAFGSYANGNAFLGFAGNSSTTGAYNTASGYSALASNTLGRYNVASGLGALSSNTSGSNNTASGSAALGSNSTGSLNTASGYAALYSNTTGSYNLASGLNALYSNIAGNYNTADGTDSLYFNTASNNTASGYEALYSNSAGTDNTASGYQALHNNSTASNNSASGYQALFGNTTGTDNAAFGFQALYDNTTACCNTASGSGALFLNTTGTNNSAFGYQALYSNTTNSGDTAFGAQALYSNTTGTNNTATGNTALYSNTTGVANTATGALALWANTTGDSNTAEGYEALYLNTAGYENTAVGQWALYNNTSGSENTAVGYASLSDLQTGEDLTCIGYECDDDADGLFNATAIGAHAVISESNSLILGGTGEFAVKVGIGTSTPSNILTIARGAGHPVSDSWETYSSRRWKTNIQTLPDALTKVEQLRGVSYDRKDNGKREIGVIAEEVGAVVPEVVSWETNGKDASGVDYSRLTAVLIEAVKQQQAELVKQSSEIARAMRQIKSQRALARAQTANIRALETKLTNYARQVQVKDRRLPNQTVVVASK
jgi:hypothetical protein